MPLYEYQCESCGHQFEAIQKFSDPLLEQCPKCQGPVRKLQSAPAFQFKGSGWYITDYARKSGDAGKSGDGKASSTDGSKPAASGDAKSGDAKPSTPPASDTTSSSKN
jgi:putative FmdB family regulatory protein